MIARTEAARAVHAASLMSAESSGVVAAKKWLLSANSCPVCHALAAAADSLPLAGEFGQVGNNPDFASVKYPPAHPHCRCSMTYVLAEEGAHPVPAFVPKPAKGPEARPKPAPRPKPEKKPRPASGPAAGAVPSPAEHAAAFPGRTITPDQVAAYTAHSAEKRVLIHRTFPEARADILANGVDPEKARGVYGQGLYVSTKPEKSFGPAEVLVAIDARNPLIGDSGDLYRKYDEWYLAEKGKAPDFFDPAEFSRLASAHGHDAIITGQFGHDPADVAHRWLCLNRPDQIRFVVPNP